MNEGPTRILLIANDTADARRLKELLADTGEGGFEWRNARKLSTGLKRLAKGDIDIALLDGSQGLDSLSGLRAVAPEVPVVVLVERADEAFGPEAVQAGAQDYLVKGQVDGQLLVRAMRYAAERVRVEKALRESETTYRSLFEDSPSPLLEEDFSEVKTYIDDLREAGVEDFRAYFENHPEAVLECRKLVKILDANSAALEFFKASDEQELKVRFVDIFGGGEEYGSFAEELVTVAEGKTRHESTGVMLDSTTGDKRHMIVRWSVPAGYEESYAKVLVSDTDITERVRAEKELLESTALLSAFGSAFPDLGFIVDKEGRYVEVVTQQEELLYGDLDQLRGKLLHEILPEEPATAILAAIHKTIETGERQRVEYSLEVPAGVRWFEGRTASMESLPGEEERVVLVVRNITERVRVEEALRESETTYRSLFEDSPSPLLEEDFSDVKTYIDELREAGVEDFRAYFEKHPEAVLDCRMLVKILDANSAALEFFKASDEQELKVRFVAMFGDEEEYSSFAEELVAVAEGKTRYENTGVLITSPTGDKRHMIVRWSVPAGYEESYAKVLVSDTEITERVQTEEALRKERDYADRLVETAPAIILTLDLEGRIVQFNRYMEQISGYCLEEVQGKDWFSTFLPAREQDRLRSVFSQALGGEQTTGTVNPVVTKDGREREIEWHNRTVKDADGTPIGVLSVGLDITERRQVEEKLQQYTNRLENLHAIDRAILAAQSPDEIANVALLYIQQLVPCSQASVALFDFEAEEFWALAVQVEGGTQYGTGARDSLRRFGGDLEALRDGEVDLVEDLLDLDQPSAVLENLLAEGIRSVMYVPLVVKEELVGSLNIGADSPAAFTPEHLEIVREVADQLAVTIQQARLYDAERDQRALAEALRDSVSTINSTLDLNSVLDGILENVGRVVPHDAANIMLIEEGQWDVAQVIRGRGYTQHGPAAEQVLAIRYPVVGVPILRLMSESEKPLVITDTRDSPDWLDVPELRWVCSYAGTPIHTEGKVVGFLNVESATPGFYTATHAERLAAFADQAATAIRNAQLYEAEQRQRVLAERLSAAAMTLSSSLTLEDVLGSIFDQLGQVVNYDSAALQKLEGNGLVIQTGAGFDEPDKVIGLRFPLEPKFPNTRVIEGRKPLAIDDVTEGYPHFQEEADTFESGHVRSWLGVPLLAKDQVIGMISLDRSEVRPFSSLEVKLVASFASQVSIAIENAQLYHELEAYSQYLMQAVEERTAELEREKLHVEAILQSAGDAIVTTNVEGRVVSVNLAFEDQTGYPADEIVGESLRSLGSWELSPEAMHGKLEAGGDENSWRSQLTIRRKDGTSYEAEVSASPLHEVGGGLRGYVGVMRDITAQKELERMKDAFVSNVSHELRTPITGIKLFLGLLERAVTPEIRDDLIPTLKRETNRLDTIIEDVLRLSRLDQGRVELKFRAVDLNTLAEEYATDRVPLAKDRGVTLTLDRAAALPPIRADAGLLGQALSVLLTNALNYTPAGGKIIISTKLREDGGNTFAGFSIRDTGPGIPPEERDRLFERFFRGAAAVASGAPGTGLGLSIAKEIVNRHGGRIEVESDGVPGKGATFTVWLPVLESGNG